MTRIHDPKLLSRGSPVANALHVRGQDRTEAPLGYDSPLPRAPQPASVALFPNSNLRLVGDVVYLRYRSFQTHFFLQYLPERVILYIQVDIAE